jgi:hypothetical protein
MRRRLAASLLGSLLALAAGCGSRSPGATVGDGPSDPCRLLTAAEVATAIEVPEGQVAAQPMPAGTPEPGLDARDLQSRGCTFEATAGDGEVVSVVAFRLSGDGMARLVFNSLKPKNAPAPVGGIGEEAFQDGSDLYVRKGSVILDVGWDGSRATPARRDPALRTLARQAAGRV